MTSKLNVADSQGTWVVAVLGVFLDMLSRGVCTARHWQTSGRLVQELNVCTVLFNIVGSSYYLVWWAISDMMPEKMGMCETVASILCDTSLLKTTDYRLKGKTFGYKMCSRCDLGIQEDARHVLMQCPFYNRERKKLFDSLESISEI